MAQRWDEEDKEPKSPGRVGNGLDSRLGKGGLGGKVSTGVGPLQKRVYSTSTTAMGWVGGCGTVQNRRASNDWGMTNDEWRVAWKSEVGSRAA